MKITVNSNNNEVKGIIRTLATMVHEVDSDSGMSVEQMVNKAQMAISHGKEITEKYYSMKWNNDSSTLEIEIDSELIAAGLEYTDKTIELWSPIIDMIKAAVKFGKSIGVQMVKLAETTFAKFKPEKKYGVFHLCMPELGLDKVAMLRKVGNSSINHIWCHDVDLENVDQNVELSFDILRTMAKNGSIEFCFDSEEEAEAAVDKMLDDCRKQKELSKKANATIQEGVKE